MKNVLVEATLAATAHINNLVNGPDAQGDRMKELMKLSKEELAKMVLATEKFDGVKVEDVVKPILEDPKCAWLDYTTIADMVKAAIVTAKTTNKSIASYASKYPEQKGWNVQPRKSQAERTAAMMQLISTTGALS
jgi:hypothetical protein